MFIENGYEVILYETIMGEDGEETDIVVFSGTFLANDDNGAIQMAEAAALRKGCINKDTSYVFECNSKTLPAPSVTIQ